MSVPLDSTALPLRVIVERDPDEDVQMDRMDGMRLPNTRPTIHIHKGKEHWITMTVTPYRTIEELARIGIFQRALDRGDRGYNLALPGAFVHGRHRNKVCLVVIEKRKMAIVTSGPSGDTCDLLLCDQSVIVAMNAALTGLVEAGTHEF
jgi:hypothetical protein